MADLASWRFRRRVERTLRTTNQMAGRGSVSEIVWRRDPHTLAYLPAGLVVRQLSVGMDGVQFWVIDGHCVKFLEEVRIIRSKL